MLTFVLRRLGVAVLVAITVSIIGFGLLRASGDLAVTLAGDNATTVEIEKTARLYGLDRPFVAQYFDWAGRALTGDFGRSLFSNEAVSELIMARLPITLFLAIPSLLLAIIVALPLGVAAAVWQNSWIDRVALSLAVVGIALPSFWFALVLISIFGVLLRWLPISGSESWTHFILPWITVAIQIVPGQMRLIRAGMLEVIASDYVRTARAKGLKPTAVLFKHALRNAILPVVSLSAVNLGFLLGGSIVVESVFALNGIGLLAYHGIQRLDFPVVQSVIVLTSLAYIVLTVLADLLNARLDPRIGIAR